MAKFDDGSAPKIDKSEKFDIELDDISESQVSYNIIVTRYIGEKMDGTIEIDRYGVLREAWNDIEEMIHKQGWSWDG